MYLVKYQFFYILDGRRGTFGMYIKFVQSFLKYVFVILRNMMQSRRNGGQTAEIQPASIPLERHNSMAKLIGVISE